MDYKIMIKLAIRKILKVLGFQKKIIRSIDDWEKIINKSVKISLKMLLPYIKDAKVFVDVGANIGAFTQNIIANKPDITVHSFEPVSVYFQRCKQKFRTNKRIIVNNFALSDSAGKVQLFLDSENLGWNTMIKEKTSSDMKEETVNTITFDEYAEKNKIERIDIMKIDVEGSEFRVLKGMKKTLSKLSKKPVILCEIGWGYDSHPNWNEEVKVFEWLFSIGYKRFDYNVKGTRDVLFIPI